MTTVSDIVTRVQAIVIDVPTAVSNYTETLVKEARRRLMTIHNFDIMERRVSASTTANSASLGTMSSLSVAGTGTFKEYHPAEPPFWTDDSGHTYFLKVAFNEAEVRRMFNQSTTYGLGEPKVLLHRHQASDDSIEDVEWKVYPIPDGLANTSDGEYTIQIPYYALITDSSTDDWFTNFATEFLVADAAAEAFLMNHDESRYAIWHMRAYGPRWDAQLIPGGFMLDAIRLDRQMQLSAVEEMVPYAGAREPRLGL